MTQPIGRINIYSRVADAGVELPGIFRGRIPACVGENRLAGRCYTFAIYLRQLNIAQHIN